MKFKGSIYLLSILPLTSITKMHTTTVGGRLIRNLIPDFAKRIQSQINLILINLNKFINIPFKCAAIANKLINASTIKNMLISTETDRSNLHKSMTTGYDQKINFCKIQIIKSHKPIKFSLITTSNITIFKNTQNNQKETTLSEIEVIKICSSLKLAVILLCYKLISIFAINENKTLQSHLQ